MSSNLPTRIRNTALMLAENQSRETIRLRDTVQVRLETVTMSWMDALAAHPAEQQGNTGHQH